MIGDRETKQTEKQTDTRSPSLLKALFLLRGRGLQITIKGAKHKK